MVQREADRCGNSYSISSLSNAAMGHFGQIRLDGKMASISNRNTLAKTSSLNGAHFRPICSPFYRLEGAVSRS